MNIAVIYEVFDMVMQWLTKSYFVDFQLIEFYRPNWFTIIKPNFSFSTIEAIFN